MIPRALTLGVSMLVFAGTAAAGGRPLPPPASPRASICVTTVGWCDLVPGPAPPGLGCFCLTADNVQVYGTTRDFPRSGTPSPYLRPHTTGVPPQTER